jgi:CMP-N-acetylneuraminic acid synthetase
MAETWGDKKVLPVQRHVELATDETSIDEVLYDWFARPGNECKYICLLNPTSPLRTSQDIKEMYRFIKKEKYDTVISVKWCDYIGWVEKATNKGPICSYNIGKRPNRQSRNDFFLENGSIYWFKHETIRLYGNMIGNPNRVKLYEMPLERSLEIDTKFDFYMAERAYEYSSMEEST